MRKMLKYRWIILIIWLIVTVLFTINQPNLKQILNQKGQVSISNDSPSKIASQMLNKMGTSKGDTALFVFGGKNKLTDEDMKDVEKGIDNLKSKKESLRINNIIDPFGTPEAKDQLVSKDGTTLIVQVTYEKGTRDSETIMKGFEDTIKNVKLEHYITGELAINRDYLKATNEGVDKSSIITVIFILLVLIIMFSSVVTPFVSLIAVAVSYLCSMGVIGILINTVDFPITSLTQMFIIIILFGIGTDYNILLFNRFKEELGKGFSVDDAVVNTFRTAGKTIIFSGMTVFIAFASLSFVQFPIYRSANAVAIGIAVLLLELMTLTPIIMKLLARKFFWPSHKSAGHKESKFWDKVTSVSVKHPAISLLVVAIIIAPVIIFNTQKLSFDSLKDMSSDTPSVKGFNIVADKFGRGKAMPTTVVLKNNEAMDNNDALAVIDNLTEKLKKLKGVKEVSGATQPKGEQITSFYTNTQTKTVVEGLSAANGGVGKIYDGLDKIKSNLSAPDFSKVNDLVKGTEKIQKGMEAIKDGLDKVNGGIDKGAGGSEQLGGGIAKLKSGVAKINEGVKNISDKLSQINAGYNALGEGYKALPESIAQIKQIVTMMQGTIGKIDSKLPNDSDVASLKAMLGKLSGALDSMSAGITKANANFDTLTAGLSKLSGGLKSIEESTSANSELVKGIDQLEKEVLEGLKQGSSGQKKIIDNMSQLIAATMKIKYGQSELSKGLNGLGSG
ncbi:MAG: MMPL family transporter, partial [Bacillota bacterium]|nr:MMPL family transporter [Bacillota bacterium]